MIERATTEPSARVGTQHREGFTLIELMIVVSILAIIIVMAVPALIASRVSANESATISALRAVASVNEQYRARFGVYGPSLTDLASAGYIDDVLAAGAKSGYSFTLVGGVASWSCTADPITPGQSGERGFFVDHSGVIRFDSSTTATAASDAI